MVESVHDTDLARLLHRARRVDLTVLHQLLDEARSTRGSGDRRALADLLVTRGLLDAEEAMEYQRRAAESAPDELPALTSSSEALLDPAEPREKRHASGRYDAEAWRPGAIVGGLRLERPLGRGAMGMVFVAVDPDTGARRAIKTVLGSDPAVQERFRREGEAQARVDAHPNVVRVHSMGEHARRPYLVLELVEGESLSDLVHMRGPMLPSDAAALGAGVARGLAHLHSRGVLHRDLKPANVLVDGDGTPRLADFGLARVAGTTRMTLTGELVGTPAYMAPEQALGRNSEVSPKTDVYALGALLYFALTGQDPFPGQTTVEVVAKIVNEAPLAPSLLRPEVPPALERIVLAAMAKEVRARPSAQEIAEELDTLGRRTAEARPSPRSRLVPVLGAGAALAVALAVLALVHAGQRADIDASMGAVLDTGRVPQRPVPSAPSPPPPPKVERVLAWPWKPGQTRRVELKFEMQSEFQTRSWGKMEMHQRRRYDTTWRAESVEGDQARLRVTIDGMSCSMRGGPRRALPFDQDSARGEPIRAVVGTGFDLSLDERTGRVEGIAGVGSVQAALNTAGVGPDEVVELMDLQGVFERLVCLLPPGEDDLGQPTWTLSRSGRNLRFLEVEPATAEVQCRRTGSTRTLTWSCESPGRMAWGRMMGAQGASILGRTAGEALLGPEGITHSSVRETWRMDAGSYSGTYELDVLPPTR